MSFILNCLQFLQFKLYFQTNTMKKTLILISILVTISAYSQVGINTETPKATLDITGKPTNTSVVDGIIIPRISGDELTAKDAIYGAEQTGTMIYVTSPSSTPDVKTVEVTAEGFYYFDGSIWKTVRGGSDINLYNANGTLTGFRTVSMPSSSHLKFEAVENAGFEVSTGSGIISFTGREQGTRINLNTVQINSQINLGTEGRFSNIKLSTSGDAVSNVLLQPDVIHTNVGIGTYDPTAKLHTNGTVRHEGLTVKNDNTKFVTTDADGNIETRSSASFLPVILVGGDGENFTSSSSTISSVSGANTEQTLATKSFTIATKSSVTFTYSIAVSNILDSTGNIIGDAMERLIGAKLQWASPQPVSSPFSAGTAFSNSSIPFSTGGFSEYVNGSYYLNGSRTIVMEAGTYNVDVISFLKTHPNDSGGIRATFVGDQLDVVAMPLQ